jgi:hypothetical protein
MQYSLLKHKSFFPVTHTSVFAGLATGFDAYAVAIVAAPDFDYETEQTYLLAFTTSDANFQSETVYLQVQAPLLMRISRENIVQ